MVKKLQYSKASSDSAAFWTNEKGEYFVEHEIVFRKELSASEKMAVIKHFVLGFEPLDAQAEGAVLQVDFLDPQRLKMTIQVLEHTKKRTTLALVVQLRKKYPVASWNGIKYPTSDS